MSISTPSGMRQWTFFFEAVQPYSMLASEGVLLIDASHVLAADLMGSRQRSQVAPFAASDHLDRNRDSLPHCAILTPLLCNWRTARLTSPTGTARAFAISVVLMTSRP